jgi:hypothetical protein
VTSDYGRDVPPTVFGTWIRVPEEESGSGVEIYRPEGRPLPPARGRVGFEVSPDGGFQYHGIGATDVPSTVEGRWRSERPGEISVELGGRGFTLEIVDTAEDVLKVKRRPAAG